MKHSKILILAFLPVLIILGSVELADAQGAIFLIDRTGSMGEPRVSGNSRCADARTVAITDVKSHFSLYPTGLGAVWTFAGEGWFNETGGFVGRAACSAAVVNLTPEGCSGSTPLAESMCGAADALVAFFPPPQQRILYVSSDGEENSSDGECDGDDAAAKPYPADSWQGKVIAKLMATGTVNVRYWGSVSKSGSSYDPETGVTRMPAISDAEFFKDVADTTGGGYSYIDDGDPHWNPATGVPTLSQWSVLLLLLLLVASGAIVFHRRRQSLRLN
ncbi:MAG: VWA domain-containing protein [bacterium]|nr:VWA domain-containing protein [bacterium]